MNRYEFPLESDSPQIILQAQGDVTVQGQEGAVLVVESLGPEPALEQTGATVTLTCAQDCQIRLPAGAQLTVSAAGDATIRQMTGPVRVEAVSGDLTLAHVGTVKVRKCHGDLTAQDVAGAFAANVGGDAKVTGVGQDLRLNTGGDALVKAVAGNLSINAGADVTLSELKGPGAKVNVGGDVVCRLDGLAGLKAKVICGGELLVENDGEVTRHGMGVHRLKGGSQTPSLAIAAGGDVQLRGLALPDLQVQGLSQELGELGELGEKLGKAGAGLGAVGARLGALLGQRLARKFSSLAQEVEIEMGQEKKREHWIKGTWSAGFRHGPADDTPSAGSPAPDPAEEAPAHEPVSDQERMVILRMVSEGTITAEEAEQLLAALENYEDIE